jgi:hypothetical protein
MQHSISLEIFQELLVKYSFLFKPNAKISEPSFFRISFTLILV